jgi:hypothetical protein
MPKFIKFFPLSFLFIITPLPTDKSEIYTIELHLVDLGHPIQRRRLEFLFLSVSPVRQFTVNKTNSTISQKVKTNPDNLKIVKIDEYFNVTLLSNNIQIFDKINSTSMINLRFFKFQIIKALSYEKIPC